MSGTVSLKNMPSDLAIYLECVAAAVTESEPFFALEKEIVDESEQGIAPDWYTDPDEFRSLHHVGEFFVIEDYEDDTRTDEEILARMLTSESDENFLDLFPIKEFPEIQLAVIVESRGQWGAWFTGVGLFRSMSALERHLLETYSFVIGGSKSTLEFSFILNHNQKTQR